MDTTLIILAIEGFVLLLGVITLLFYLRWKKKKHITNEFELLLNDIETKKNERTEHLINHLIEEYSINKDEAEETSEYMVEAEKQFLQQFIKQQMEQSSVTDFYTNLCELLDQYLYFIPSQNTSSNTEILTASEQISTEMNISDTNEQDNSSKTTDDNSVGQAENLETVQENKQPQTASEETEGEPDWGDAFAESGDTVDEDVQANFDDENKKQENNPIENKDNSKKNDTSLEPTTEDTEEEPDWGDAFAESGDTVDKDVQANFDDENKKIESN